MYSFLKSARDSNTIKGPDYERNIRKILFCKLIYWANIKPVFNSAESSFSRNHTFNKKRNLHVSFFLVLYLTPFVADITFITLLLSQIDVCTSSYRLFNVPVMITSAKGPTNFQNLCYKCYKSYIQSYFVPNLLQIEQILKKLERVFQ